MAAMARRRGLQVGLHSTGGVFAYPCQTFAVDAVQFILHQHLSKRALDDDYHAKLFCCRFGIKSRMSRYCGAIIASRFCVGVDIRRFDKSRNAGGQSAMELSAGKGKAKKERRVKERY